MTAGKKGLFIFLMGLAWRCRFSMPLLLSGSLAVLGHAWMFQIRVHTVHRLHENEVISRVFATVLGHAWMFQIRVHPVHHHMHHHVHHEHELAYYEDEDDEDDEEDSWEAESTDSWETIVEEVAHG